MKKEKNAVLRFFARFSRFIYGLIIGSFIGKLFSSYGPLNERICRVGKHRAARAANGRKHHYTIRRAIACAMEQNIFSRARRWCVAALVESNLRTVGFFFTVLGAAWIALYGATLLAFISIGVTFDHLIAGGVVLFVGVLLLFSDHSVGAMLRHRSFLGGLMFGVFGLHDDVIRGVKTRGKQHFGAAALLAIAVAALGLLVMPLSLIAILGTLSCVLMILSVPEVGFLLALLFLPFSKLIVGSDAITLTCFAFMVFGYVGKLLRGNRVFRLELQDIPVLFFLLLFALSARTPATGAVWRDVLLELLIVLTYLIAVNILSTPHWLSVTRIAFTCSAFFAAAFGIGQLVYAMLNTDGATLSNIADFGPVVTAGFADRNAFAYYLVIAFAFVLPSIAFTSSRRRALPIFVAFCLAAGVLLTFNSAVLLALILILVVFLLVYEYRSMPFLLLTGGAVSGSLFILKKDIRQRILGFFRDFSDPALLSLRRVGRDTLSRLFAGNGEGMFSKTSAVRRLIFGTGHRGLEALYPYFGDLATPFGMEAYHFFEVLLVNYGLVGVVVCALFFLLLLQNCFSVLSTSRDHGKSLFAHIGIVLVSALVFLGFFCYVWYDLAALSAFFCAAALVAAAMRYDRLRRQTFSEDEHYGRPVAEIEYAVRAPRKAKKGGVAHGEASQ
ncbi:MAG: hypothetical protein IKC75_08005 [Clostridia bacterium]|nr:hypothetical protein [Clostridia bacterium]